ncbi:hypothetical protein E4U58_001855 [Claviceps cyperi]|nr:hypothetical protein E4U58_001855 [Claviceps cyperi]
MAVINLKKAPRREVKFDVGNSVYGIPTSIDEDACTLRGADKDPVSKHGGINMEAADAVMCLSKLAAK